MMVNSDGAASGLLKEQGATPPQIWSTRSWVSCQYFNLFQPHPLTFPGELKRLFMAESILDTAKFGLSLYCLTYIGTQPRRP